MTTKFVGMKELRQNMAKLTKQAQQKNERLIILRKNKPIFELRPLSKQDATLERLALDIQEGLEDAKAGRVYSHKEMKEYFGIL